MKNKNKKFRVILCIFSIFAPVVLFNNSYAVHTISISATGSDTITVSGAGDGVSIDKTTINVATTCSAGYNLSLSTTVNDSSLYFDGNPNINTSGTFISPVDGLSSLVSSSNAWGFYFSDNVIPTSNSVFSPLPTLDNYIPLKTPTETARSTTINDTLSLYYGVKVSGDLPSGYYKMKEDDDGDFGKIVYYATLPEDCFRYLVEYNPTGTNLGTAVTGTGSVPSQYISEGITENLTTNVYGNPVIDGMTYYFMGWNTAQDGSGTSYASGQAVTDLAAAGNTISLYAQWNDCPSEKVCYYKNNANAEGSMGFQDVVSNSDIMLLAPNYSLPNYGFAGWSEDKNAAIKLANNEAVTIYGPNQTITTGDLSEIGLRLYAVWLESYETLQEWDSCNELEIGDVIALRDARDNNAYAIAKLADGRCWMIENLRLESGNSIGDKSLLSQGYDESFIGLAGSEDSNFSDSAIANSLYSTNGATEKTIVGDYIGSRFPRYNNLNTLFVDEKPNDGAMSIYNYGDYYTWSAVIANTNSYYSQNAVIDSSSICPNGWKIPRGGDKTIESNNDYWVLVVDGINDGIKPNNYNSFTRSYYSGSVEGSRISNLLRTFPNNMIYSGYYSNISALNRGSIGGYWTSVTSISNSA